MRPQDISAEEPDGGNLHVRIWRGPGLGNWLRLLNNGAMYLASSCQIGNGGAWPLIMARVLISPNGLRVKSTINQRTASASHRPHCIRRYNPTAMVSQIASPISPAMSDPEIASRTPRIANHAHRTTIAATVQRRKTNSVFGPAVILWSLSAKVLDHSSDTKRDGGEQNRDDDRRPSGRVRGHEPRRDNKKSSRESCHCYPLLGDSRNALTSGFLRERSRLR